MSLQYNRSPNLYEKYGDGAFVRPNTLLEWEDGTQWDLGATWTGKIKNADLKATLTYFGRHANNLMEFMMTDPRYGQYQNIGKADINGLEFESTIILGKWNINTSATWMRAINKSDDFRKDHRIPNRPEFEGLLRATRTFLKDDRASAFAEFHYMGNNYFDTVETKKVDDLFTVGIGLKYKFSGRTKLVLGVDDIFDKSPDTKFYNVSSSSSISRTMWYPLQGRTFYATFFWEF